PTAVGGIKRLLKVGRRAWNLVSDRHAIFRTFEAKLLSDRTYENCGGVFTADCSRRAVVFFGAERVADVGRGESYFYWISLVDSCGFRTQSGTSTARQTARDRAVVVVAAEVAGT